MLKQLFTEVEVARGKYPPLKTETPTSSFKDECQDFSQVEEIKKLQ